MKPKLRKTYNYLLQLGIIIIVYAFLYNELFQKRDFSEFRELFDAHLNSPNKIFLFITAIILILLNLGIESVKWKFIILKIEKVSFRQAFQAILSGISFSVFTPNRIGDFMGRVFLLKKANRIEGSILTFLGSASQLTAILFFGCIGLVFYVPFYFDLDPKATIGIVIFVLLLNALLLFLFINIPYITGILNKLTGKYKEKINAYFISTRRFTSKELFRVFVLSSFRYIVFNFQFYLLLLLFGIDIPLLHSYMISSVMYVVLTVIPTIAITELGVRGSVAVFLFQQYFDKLGIVMEGVDIAVFAASAYLWLMNIILPAIFGTFFVFRLKFFRNNHA